MSASCHLWPSFDIIATDLPLVILGSEHSLFLKEKWQQAWHCLSSLVLWNRINDYRGLICWISVLRLKDFIYFQHSNRGPHLGPNKSATTYYWSLNSARVTQNCRKVSPSSQKDKKIHFKTSCRGSQSKHFQIVCQQKYLIAVLLLSQRAFNVCFLEQKATLTHLCMCKGSPAVPKKFLSSSY